MGAQLNLSVIYSLLLVVNLVYGDVASTSVVEQQQPQQQSLDKVSVQCANDMMLITIEPAPSPVITKYIDHESFSGMVYPRGLTKNSSCLAEFVKQKGALHYKLPLSSCNTMSTDLDDGGVEYYNTIVVQPHLKLVTSQGRGYHVRCRYETREKTPVFLVNSTSTGMQQLTAALIDVEAMPGCTMRIFSGNPNEKQVAENVKIGDPLTLVIKIDQQDIYGIKITDCIVRDGLSWGEQKLLSKQGCPLNNEIMGEFQYSEDSTKASVSFPAHKFPYTASVYYQCHVKLCKKDTPECGAPVCGQGSNNVRRRRQQDSTDEGSPATIEVYSGLYVNEGSDVNRFDPFDDVNKEKADDPDTFCISQRTFALAVAIAGLILMLLVLLAVLVLCARRRRHKDTSTSGSSLYSGPYTNTAYSHSS